MAETTTVYHIGARAISAADHYGPRLARVPDWSAFLVRAILGLETVRPNSDCPYTVRNTGFPLARKRKMNDD